MTLKSASQIERMNNAEKSPKVGLPDRQLNVGKYLVLKRLILTIHNIQLVIFIFTFIIVSIFMYQKLLQFLERGISYLRVESLDGLNDNRIHAILYE